MTSPLKVSHFTEKFLYSLLGATFMAGVTWGGVWVRVCRVEQVVEQHCLVIPAMHTRLAIVEWDLASHDQKATDCP